MGTNERKKLTIRDVAVNAKVSAATVGRVIGGYGSVSAHMTKKVNEAVKALGYYPDGIAQSMKNKTTHTLGIIVANICNPFFGTIVRAAEDAAERNGYNIIVCNTDEDIRKELLYAETLLQKKVDGLIVASAYFKTAKEAQKIRQLYGEFMPTVLIDRKILGLGLPTITTDNTAASYNATSFLINLGHKRIAIVSGIRRLSSLRERIQGYIKALTDKGITVENDLIIDCGNLVTQGGYKAAAELFTNGKKRPTAIIALNSLLTEGVLKYISEIGINIPRDVSVVGWDDFELATVLSPPLTVVRQHPYAIGKAAAELIIAHLKGQIDEIAFSKSTMVMDCDLIIRKSVILLKTEAPVL